MVAISDVVSFSGVTFAELVNDIELHATIAESKENCD